jgi:hypothetical protein
VSKVMRPFYCERELAIDKPADEVWDWLSDIRNAMTLNQFHEFVEADPSDARTGVTVPLHHDFCGFKHVRLARISAWGDLTVGWGERMEDTSVEDPFPHGESWKVIPVDKKRCTIRNSIRGAYTGPVGRVIGPHVWPAMFPQILDRDLQELAFSVGAIPEKRAIVSPEGTYKLHMLMLTSEINGMPAEEFLEAGKAIFGDA